MLRESQMSSPLTHKLMFFSLHVNCFETSTVTCYSKQTCASLLHCCYHIPISYIDLKYFVFPVDMLILKSRIFYYIAIQYFYK